MCAILGSRAFCLFLTLTIAGLTGFVHPVLCFENDGRVRLEMDASQCCAAVPPPSDAGSACATIASIDCGDCTDLYYSTPGAQSGSNAPFAFAPQASDGANRPEDVRYYPLSIHPPSAPAPPPPPPSNLRC